MWIKTLFSLPWQAKYFYQILMKNTKEDQNQIKQKFDFYLDI